MPVTRDACLPAIAIAALLAACTRAPQDSGGGPAATAHDGGSANAAAVSDRGTAGAGDNDPLQSYYQSLVARHGEDIALCPQAASPDAAACAEGAAGAEQDAPRRILLMLDASGSMAARQGGQTKLAIAQEALLAFASRLGGDAQVALRVYGHKGGNREQDKPESCRATELVQPFAPRDAEAFEAAVRSFQPSGFTPIAASLEAAARDFAAGGATALGNVVYLVSDGIETCDGDPAAAARALRASDIGVVVNVIGFDVDAVAARQLRTVAEAGGGEFVAARDSAALNATFNARLAELTARFNCRIREGADAFNTTVHTHAARFNCLVDKAGREFNAVVAAAGADATAGRATRAQRDYAVDQARAKREGIIEPAQAARNEAVDRARGARDAGVDGARSDRQRAREAARDARGG